MIFIGVLITGTKLIEGEPGDHIEDTVVSREDGPEPEPEPEPAGPAEPVGPTEPVPKPVSKRRILVSSREILEWELEEIEWARAARVGGGMGPN